MLPIPGQPIIPSAAPSSKINKFLNRSLALKGGKQQSKTWERRTGRSSFFLDYSSYCLIQPNTEFANLQQTLVSFDVTAQLRTLFGIDKSPSAPTSTGMTISRNTCYGFYIILSLR